MLVQPASQAEQADRDVAHRRHDLGRGTGPHLGAVLVVGTVPDVVLAVLDLPVAAVVGEQVGWVRLLRGAAGDPVDGLGLADQVVVEIAGLAADADGLEHPGEVDGCDVAGGGDLADLGAAVAAVEGDVVRGQRLTRRGSTRPARAPASAGCPARLSTYSPPRSSSASMLPRCPGSAAAVMTVPVRSPLPSSVRCPATAASSGTTSGELVGVRGDGALTDDNPLAVPERGEQPDLSAAGIHLGPGAVERLAVQRECGAGRDPLV